MAVRDPIDLDVVRRATDQSSSSRAYGYVLDTVGHNHSGTLYTEAEAAVAPLMRIAVEESGWPAVTALDVLIDLLGCFDGHAVATQDHPPAPAGMRQRMRAEARQRIPELAQLASRLNGQVAPRAAELIATLGVEND